MPENSYFAHYIPLLIQVIVAMALAAVMVTLSHLLGKRKWTRAKNTAYECGIEPTGDAQQRFSVKFYMVGMLFILFDVAAVFLYPWAVIARSLKMFGFWEMLVYIGLVLVGFFYVWKKGFMDWDQNAVQEARFDRNELTIYVARESIRPVCTQLKSQGLIDFLSDVTCADYYPRDPRFEIVYHLLSMKRKERVRLKVRLDGNDPVIESITALWPSAN